jgi:hypothetical protein
MDSIQLEPNISSKGIQEKAMGSAASVNGLRPESTIQASQVQASQTAGRRRLSGNRQKNTVASSAPAALDRVKVWPGDTRASR